MEPSLTLIYTVKGCDGPSDNIAATDDDDGDTAATCGDDGSVVDVDGETDDS